MIKKLLLAAGLALLFVLTAIYLALPAIIDRRLNIVNRHPITISAKARQLHKNLFIVDLHADSLLWDRNLLIRNRRGHIDVPRLIEGNVAVQAFTIVTKMPDIFGFVTPLKPGSATAQGRDTDLITWLAVADHWPFATFNSLKERTIYQARNLAAYAARSNGQLTIIKSAADLDEFLKRRKTDQACVAAFLGVEGAHALDGDLRNLDLFYDYGIRMMSPSHFFDNDIGGSSFGEKQIGLTDKGRLLIEKMEAKSMIVDLAHASRQTIKDVLAIAKKPVIVSHTGVKGTCDTKRNLSDDEIVAIAKGGGLIGIGYWRQAVCGDDAQAIARAIRYTVDLAGIEHVALGSDFDGATTVPFDASELVILTQALMNEHFTDDQIRSIMGGNSVRVLHSLLPEN